MIYRKIISKDKLLEKRDILYSFESLFNSIVADGDGGLVQMSLQCKYDLKHDKSNYESETLEIYLVPYESPRIKDFIENWEFEEVSVLPENLKLLLGVRGMEVCYLA